MATLERKQTHPPTPTPALSTFSSRPPPLPSQQTPFLPPDAPIYLPSQVPNPPTQPTPPIEGLWRI
ncbi:hypothetical protein E2C01_002550 [Portunus trituberculatus]|uniref:Uncharacterized protein n=1 Tax=Portunus trituberculatus TaxID=210409 RepID=A0A5B7CKN7_PORTR|nr:hypothetical protein [Portunus trituberculatus]